MLKCDFILRALSPPRETYSLMCEFSNMRSIFSRVNSYSGIGVMLVLLILTKARAEDQWVDYKGHDGPGHGKQIVLISGDEEYRSEEALPQLGRFWRSIMGSIAGCCLRLIRRPA